MERTWVTALDDDCGTWGGPGKMIHALTANVRKAEDVGSGEGILEDEGADVISLDAVPDLLASLEAMVKDCEARERDFAWRSKRLGLPSFERSSMLKAAQAAIEKAKGG